MAQDPSTEGADEDDTVTLNKSRLPEQQPYKIRLDDLTPMPTRPEENDSIQVPLILPRFQLHLYEAEPGAEKVWHTHYPSMFQVIVGLEGEIMYEYIDDDGEKQTLTVGPGEVVYLPGGFKHRTEVISEEHHRHLYVFPYVPSGRMEQLMGERDVKDGYQSMEDIAGLWLDDVSDTVIAMDDDAVEKL